MPQLIRSTEIVGTVTQKAAEQTGLKPGIPVIAGCLDAIAGALGSGVVKAGSNQRTGWASWGCRNQPGSCCGGTALDFFTPRDSRAVSPASWNCRRWIAQLVQGPARAPGSERRKFDWSKSVRAVQQTSCESKPGANGLIFLPYMAGERTPLWSSIVRGVFFGLTYSTTRADMLRAIMEGCAFAVNDNLQIAEEHGVSS